MSGRCVDRGLMLIAGGLEPPYGLNVVLVDVLREPQLLEQLQYLLHVGHRHRLAGSEPLGDRDCRCILFFEERKSPGVFATAGKTNPAPSRGRPYTPRSRLGLPDEKQRPRLTHPTPDREEPGVARAEAGNAGFTPATPSWPLQA